MDHPGLWGTWSQFLKLPFSNYLTAFTVRTFVSRGTGAEVRKDRCVKPSRLHNSSQTQKSKLCFVGKRKTSLFISLWLTPGCLSPEYLGIMLRQLLAPPPTLEHMYMHRALWEQHPIIRTPTLASSSSIPSADSPCSSLKISWGFRSFCFKEHDYQGGEGTLKILAHAFEFSTLTPFLSPILCLPLTCSYFWDILLFISIASRMFL